MTAILWSGGNDSTLLLHDLATKAKQDGYTIDAYTIHHPQIANSHLENHQKQTLKQPTDIGLNNINYHHITINTTHDIQPIGIPQAAIWIGTIPPYLKPLPQTTAHPANTTKPPNTS
jgi:tRNA(Ile)-lysidine synthase TilS/MesJ